MSEQTKKEFEDNVDRDGDFGGRETKLNGLLDKVDDFNQEMNATYERVTRYTKIYEFFGQSNNMWYLELVLFLISLVICMLMLQQFALQYKSDGVQIYDGKYSSQITILAIIEIVLSFVCLMLWILFYYPTILIKELSAYNDSIF